MALIKPEKLNPGGTIAVVSPAWGGAGMFPHRVAQGKQQVEHMGYKLRFSAHALKQNGWVSAPSIIRAADIHAMFLNPDVNAIIAAIGGDHANQILPLLDFDLIRTHAKIFMGYSDITVLNMAIWKMTGLVTFNGPAFLTDFAEYPAMPEYTREYFEKAVCHDAPVGEVSSASEWTEEFLDWEQQLDTTRPRRMQPSPGWQWLKPGQAEGVLLGGCLESLDHLRGTPYWPDESQWQGALLFIETSEEAPPPARVDSILMDYENMGIFDRIGGLLVGRPMGYSPEQKTKLHEVLLDRTAKYSFPVVTGMDFGHTAPQFTLPLGCRARIESEARIDSEAPLDNKGGVFKILEAAVV